jgi:hypothetical protein
VTCGRVCIWCGEENPEPITEGQYAGGHLRTQSFEEALATGRSMDPCGPLTDKCATWATHRATCGICSQGPGDGSTWCDEGYALKDRDVPAYMAGLKSGGES